MNDCERTKRRDIDYENLHYNIIKFENFQVTVIQNQVENQLVHKII